MRATIASLGAALLAAGAASGQEPSWGGRTYTEWRSQLDEDAPQRRVATCEALARMGAYWDAPRIAELLFAAEEPLQRRRLLRVLLGELGPAGVDAVLKRLPDARDARRLEVLQALPWRPRGHREQVARTVAALVPALGPKAQAAAIEVLRARRAAPDASVGALVPLLGDPALQTDAAEALGALGEAARAAAPALVRQLAGDDANAARSAAQALGQIGGEPATAALVAALERKERRRRLAAAGSLAWLGAAPGRGVPVLMDVAKRARADGDETSLLEALSALGDYGPAAEPAADLLTGLVAAAEAPLHARTRAADALARIGPAAARGAVGPLRTLLRDEELGSGRFQVLGALGVAGAAAAPAVPELTAALETEDATFAASALGAVGEAAAPAVPALAALFADPRRPSLAPARALARIGGDEALAALDAALTGGDENQRDCAALALVEVGRRLEAALPAVIALLGHREELRRLLALRALAGAGPAARAALPEVRRLAADDPSRAVRRDAAEVAGRLAGGEAPR